MVGNVALLCVLLTVADTTTADGLATPSPAPQQAEQAVQSESKQEPQARTETRTDGQAELVPAQSGLEEREVDGVSLAAIEANIVSYTNHERVRFGLPPLSVDKDLMESARGHAAWMTRNRAMVHTSRPFAENIAMGQPHSSDAVRAWMNSSGHRANILNFGHRRIGVAAYRTDGGTIFWCQQFRP